MLAPIEHTISCTVHMHEQCGLTHESIHPTFPPFLTRYVDPNDLLHDATTLAAVQAPTCGASGLLRHAARARMVRSVPYGLIEKKKTHAHAHFAGQDMS